MKFFNKKMGVIYTILGAFCQIAVVIFGFLAYYSDKSSERGLKGNGAIFNINGDYINKEGKVNNDLESKNDKDEEKIVPKVEKEFESTNEKSQINQGNKPIKESTPSVNNGIINSGVNNGNQTVNNFNDPLPRQINDSDRAAIKDNIPKDYQIDFSYVNRTQESVEYAQQIFTELQKGGYNVGPPTSIGVLVDGVPIERGDRFKIYKDEPNKMVRIIIKEQR